MEKHLTRSEAKALVAVVSCIFFWEFGIEHLLKDFQSIIHFNKDSLYRKKYGVPDLKMNKSAIK